MIRLPGHSERVRIDMRAALAVLARYVVNGLLMAQFLLFL